MFSKISVLVPTRGRPARLQTLLDSYASTVVDKSEAELVFRIDDDDLVSRNFLANHGHDYRLLIGPRRNGYRSMPTFFNELATASEGDVLMCGNDDMVFKTVNWPSAILAAANVFPDGLFDLGVTTHNEEHFPFSIVSRQVVKTLGFIWDPRIFWGDIFLRDVMAAFHRKVMLPIVEIEHDWAGFHPDLVFIESDKGIPANYWQDVHVPAVHEAVAKLERLRA